MENKNNILGVLGGIVIGIVIGYLTWSGKPVDTHVMPDGTVMNNEEMSMEAMMHDMNAELVGKTGDEFDQAFLSEMIVHHEGAVVMAEAVLKNSKRPELINLANNIIKAQTDEIQMMKGWLTSWFK